MSDHRTTMSYRCKSVIGILPAESHGVFFGISKADSLTISNKDYGATTFCGDMGNPNLGVYPSTPIFMASTKTFDHRLP